MMMGMGSAWMALLYMLLTLFMVLGFAYIIWTIAAKENGGSKLAGQIISVVIIVLAVVLCIYGGIKSNQMRHKMMGGGMGCPMGSGMMEGKGMMKGKEGPGGMEKHMGKGMMKKMMKENYKETK
ncbi:MAG TPA: hypothetical protein VMT55_04655 [Candidatus Sulfotelmatobacter sp.]|nr:hypothetical protein [Candidatus Sulfotelmatobacter sp.]